MIGYSVWRPMAKYPPHLVEQLRPTPTCGTAPETTVEVLSIRIRDEATGIRVTLAREVDLCTAGAFDHQLSEVQPAPNAGARSPRSGVHRLRRTALGVRRLTTRQGSPSSSRDDPHDGIRSGRCSHSQALTSSGPSGHPSPSLTQPPHERGATSDAFDPSGETADVRPPGGNQLDRPPLGPDRPDIHSN